MFQQKTARKLHEWNGRDMLAMDPRLGKTLSALMYAHRHPQALPVVVLCPASIKWAWQRQCRDHFGWNATVLEGMQPPKGPLQTNDPVVILNYDILASWVDKLKDFHPKMIVFDECQALCHSRAKRTKSAKLLAKGVQHIVPLSGTPLMNRPAEMYNVLHMLRPKMFPSAWSFYQRYCDLKRRPWGWEYKGATNTEELHAIITDPKTGCMIRYRKQDVLHELPAKRRIIVPLPISNRKEYEFAKNDFINWLAQRNISRLSAAERATCFPYNTLVDTELGRLPIGEIVENELKLKVRCVDTKTSEIQ
jgi:SWI/SNF-related matrix-associated actin-dependent regulator 1 of chromatin subfamily A